MFSREERINRIITQGKKNWILRRRRENLNLPFETHAYAVRVNHTIMLIFHYFSRSKSESESIYPPSFLSLHRPSINYSNNFHARLPTTHGRPLFGLRGLVASLESSLFKLCRLVWADNSAITFQRIETGISFEPSRRRLRIRLIRKRRESNNIREKWAYREIFFPSRLSVEANIYTREINGQTLAKLIFAETSYQIRCFSCWVTRKTVTQ